MTSIHVVSGAWFVGPIFVSIGLIIISFIFYIPDMCDWYRFILSRIYLGGAEIERFGPNVTIFWFDNFDVPSFQEFCQKWPKFENEESDGDEWDPKWDEDDFQSPIKMTCPDPVVAIKNDVASPIRISTPIQMNEDYFGDRESHMDDLDGVGSDWELI